MSVQPNSTAQLFRGDCPGCGAAYPYCDCSRDEDAEVDAHEGWYTAMEILDA